MKILAFGASGQVGAALARMGGVTVLPRAKADLSDPEACAEAIHAAAPDAVINAAAYTAVDKAEEDEALATTINGHAPGAMAWACADLDIPFVHISTDYVFAGGGETPSTPDDATGPLGAYGRSKLIGEQAVQAANGTYAILRTSWVFSETGANFLKTMLRLGADRDALSIVADQIGGPTPAADIATACGTIAKSLAKDPSKTGIYHFSGTPDCSWADFATEIFKRADLSVEITPIPTSAYPTPATRPLNSRMDCSATSKTFGIERPDWRVGLDAVLKALNESDHE